jgi:hypothetical protein
MYKEMAAGLFHFLKIFTEVVGNFPCRFHTSGNKLNLFIFLCLTFKNVNKN